MHGDVALLLAGANVDMCAAGGSIIVPGFSKLVEIAKYLLATSIALMAAIWLVDEFFRDGDRGSFKTAGFLLNYQLPLMILLLAVGVLFGLAPTVFGAGLQKPC